MASPMVAGVEATTERHLLQLQRLVQQTSIYSDVNTSILCVARQAETTMMAAVAVTVAFEAAALLDGPSANAPHVESHSDISEANAALGGIPSLREEGATLLNAVSRTVHHMHTTLASHSKRLERMNLRHIAPLRRQSGALDALLGANQGYCRRGLDSTETPLAPLFLTYRQALRTQRKEALATLRRTISSACMSIVRGRSIIVRPLESDRNSQSEAEESVCVAPTKDMLESDARRRIDELIRSLQMRAASIRCHRDACADALEQQLHLLVETECLPLLEDPGTSVRQQLALSNSTSP